MGKNHLDGALCGVFRLVRCFPVGPTAEAGPLELKLRELCRIFGNRLARPATSDEVRRIYRLTPLPPTPLLPTFAFGAQAQGPATFTFGAHSKQ